MNTEKNNPKEIRAWCMYDWANSVFTLTITTVIFPIFFTEVTSSPGKNDLVQFLGFELKNTVLYSYTLSTAFLIIAFINPLLSGIADYSSKKKLFMKFFTYLGSLACSALFFFDGTNLVFGVVCFGLATIGYAGSLVFYNAFLPEIVTADQMDKVSAKGYSFGYIGSVILLIINLIVVLSPKTFGITDGKLPSQIAFLSVGIWWAGFAQYSFKNLPNDKKGFEITKSVLTKGYKEVSSVFKIVQKTPLMRWFLVSFFFYAMGFQTIMYFASLFGEIELKLPLEGLIISMLLLQLIAIPGANLFSKMSAKYGNVKVLISAVVVCVFVCICAFFVTTHLQFYLMAAVVGIIMGGIQSLSRSTFSKLIPEMENNSSFFSFYELTEKVAIVLGTASYGLLLQLSGTMRNSVLGLTIFFVVGLLGLIYLNKISLSTSPLNPKKQ
jgi:UMF1 family MFS transporter